MGSEQHQVGTAMCEIPVGSGIILLNTLDFENSLQKNNSGTKMASALLRNIILHYSAHKY